MDLRLLYLRRLANSGKGIEFRFGMSGLVWEQKRNSEAEEAIKQLLMEWIDLRLYCGNDISSASIAEKTGTTKEEVNDFVWKTFKKKFPTIRKELRIEDAKRLLSETDIPISNVCKMVGFNDKSDFRKQFRETVGYTSSEWRISGKEQNRYRRLGRILNWMNNTGWKRTYRDRAVQADKSR